MKLFPAYFDCAFIFINDCFLVVLFLIKLRLLLICEFILLENLFLNGLLLQNRQIHDSGPNEECEDGLFAGFSENLKETLTILESFW